MCFHFTDWGCCRSILLVSGGILFGYQTFNLYWQGIRMSWTHEPTPTPTPRPLSVKETYNVCETVTNRSNTITTDSGNATTLQSTNSHNTHSIEKNFQARNITRKTIVNSKSMVQNSLEPSYLWCVVHNHGPLYFVGRETIETVKFCKLLFSLCWMLSIGRNSCHLPTAAPSPLRLSAVVTKFLVYLIQSI